MTTRLAIAGFYHETNTFASNLTTLQDFKNYQLEFGIDMISRYRGTSTELGGMIQGAEDNEITLVPILFSAAVPSGIISSECLQYICSQYMEALAQAKVDGLLLVLHGAAVAESVDDADGYLLARIREVFGNDRPIAVTTDFHANISALMFDEADVIVGYDSFPHIDMYDRGVEAVDHLISILKVGRFAKTYRAVPLLTAPQRQCSSDQPVASIFKRLHELENFGNIVSGTIAMGFPYADTNEIGATVLCYGRNEETLHAAVDELSSLIWSYRHNFEPILTKLNDLASVLHGISRGPVILVDPADNIGGGSAGDGTAVLSALLKADITGAVVVINDPDGAKEAGAVGEGEHYTGRIGAKSDMAHGEPVQISGNVLFRGDTSFKHSGSYMTGFVTKMGYCALLDVNGNKILLTSLRTMPFDIEQLRAVGIEPSEQRIIVVKSATAWRAAYEPIAVETIYLDTPGICPSNLHRLPYRKHHPVFPLDESINY